MKAKRAKIELTASLVVDGWMVAGMYYMSATDAGRSIKKVDSSILKFMQSKAANVLSDKDKSFLRISDPEGKGSVITLYTTKAVFTYWVHWCTKNNPYAHALILALGVNSLERLYDIAFQGEQKSEQNYSQTREDTRDELLKKLMESREMCRIAHGGFQRTCLQLHYPANHAHDWLTLMICGMDAQKAKELEMVLLGDPNIGLDHYNYAHDLALRQLAQAKRSFAWIKDDTLTLIERVDRAVKIAQRKVKI